MDDIVLRGMAKWPNVPAVFGWLTLNRRGQWLIKGEPIGNPAVSAFIARNYECDHDGRWFFQNGPQRVFATLDYTPFVYRAAHSDGAALVLEAHTGAQATSVSGAWIDENGALLLETEHGVGVVHDQSLETVVPAFSDANGNPLSEDALDALLERLQTGRDAALWLRYGASNVNVRPLRSTEAPRRFGFDLCLVPPESGAECA